MEPWRSRWIQGTAEEMADVSKGDGEMSRPTGKRSRRQAQTRPISRAATFRAQSLVRQENLSGAFSKQLLQRLAVCESGHNGAPDWRTGRRWRLREAKNREWRDTPCGRALHGKACRSNFQLWTAIYRPPRCRSMPATS